MERRAPETVSTQALGITAWNGESLGNPDHAGWPQIEEELSPECSSGNIPARSWLRVVPQCLQARPPGNQSLRFQFSEWADVVAQTKWAPLLFRCLALKPGE